MTRRGIPATGKKRRRPPRERSDFDIGLPALSPRISFGRCPTGSLHHPSESARISANVTTPTTRSTRRPFALRSAAHQRHRLCDQLSLPAIRAHDRDGTTRSDRSRRRGPRRSHHLHEGRIHPAGHIRAATREDYLAYLQRTFVDPGIVSAEDVAWRRTLAVAIVSYASDRTEQSQSRCADVGCVLPAQSGTAARLRTARALSHDPPARVHAIGGTRRGRRHWMLRLRNVEWTAHSARYARASRYH